MSEWLELADAHGSDPCARKGVGVRISPWTRKNMGISPSQAYGTALLMRGGNTHAGSNPAISAHDQGETSRRMAPASVPKTGGVSKHWPVGVRSPLSPRTV